MEGIMRTTRKAVGQNKRIVLFLLWVAVVGLTACGGEGGTTAVPLPVEKEVATIVSPPSGGTALVNTGEEITVSVPTGISEIELRSTLGTWSVSGSNTQSWTALSGPITVSDTLTSTTQGTATIAVVDSSSNEVTDSIELSFVAEEVDANSIVSVQATPATIAVSSETTESSSAIEAVVTNASGGAIADAQVNFSLSNTTDSGEYISPQVAYTNAQGVATATLYAGTQTTSGSGLTVTAFLDEALTGTPVSTSTDVVVVGTRGSIMIAKGTTVTSVNADTAYSLPTVVFVSDAAGNPLPGVDVNLGLWPLEYGLGTWECDPVNPLRVETVLANEDLDRDTELDLLPASEDISGDGKLTPSAVDGGVIPLMVTTDASGMAQFNITYQKDSAGFIYDEITASATMNGVEVTAFSRFWLPALEGDVTSCSLSESPFNVAWPRVSATANFTTVTVGGSTAVNVILTDPSGTPLTAQEVYAEFVQWGTSGTTSPTLTSSPQITDASGSTTFTYTSGDQAGVDEIRFYYISSGVYLSDYEKIAAE